MTCRGCFCAGGVILSQLLEWLRWHFVEADKSARAALELEKPQDHPAYWDAVSVRVCVCV